MAARALVCECIGLPVRRAGVGSGRRGLLARRGSACREHVESAVGLRALEEAPLIRAAKHKLRHVRERCKTPRSLQPGKRFRVNVTDRGLMPVLWPHRPNLATVAEHTFIPTNHFRAGCASTVCRFNFSRPFGCHPSPRRNCEAQSRTTPRECYRRSGPTESITLLPAPSHRPRSHVARPDPERPT